MVSAFVLQEQDADSSSEVTGGLFTFVEAGSSNADNAYVLNISNRYCNTRYRCTLVFSQFSGAGQVTAGAWSC